MSNPWTPDRIEIIKARWAAGHSATQISMELGNNISRNAVIGKIHRLGLSGPNTLGPNRTTAFRSTLPRQSRHDAATPAKVFTPRIVDAPAPEAIGAWEDFSSGCQDIAEHPAFQPWRCCGQPRAAIPGTRYCEYHHARNHQQKLAPEPVEVFRNDTSLAIDELPLPPTIQHYGRAIKAKAA